LPRPPVVRYLDSMAKKKKRREAASPAGQKPAKAEPFNNPFVGMKKDLLSAATPPAPARVPRPASAPEPPPASDQDLFAQAMEGVAPLAERSRRQAPLTPDKKPPRLVNPMDEDLEVLAHMADLISGGGEFDLRLTDEFVQGSSPAVGPELLERLSQGAFPIQDYLDLHGLGVEPALAQAEKFLGGCATRGLRHVLIVHGKGLGSPLGEPVLKKALAQALSQKRMQKRVLAFCTARPVDGGAGAMYVLLRKWAGPTGPYSSRA